jgi:transposase InsO family protein
VSYDSVLTVVDTFSKRVHFVPTTTTVDAEGVARLILDNVVRLHGLPRAIVSDRDPKFTSLFWQSLMTALGVDLHLTTANHPQSDGQSERYHRTLQEYLRAFVSHNQTDWCPRLATAEFAINNAFHAGIQTTPFLLDLGYSPSSGLEAAACTPSAPREVAAFVGAQASAALAARDALLAAQAAALHADVDTSSRRYSAPHPGDLVLVATAALQPPSARDRPSRKLGFPYQGPFRVLDRPGPATVRVELPHGVRAHNVINLEYVKPYQRDPDLPPPPPAVVGADGDFEYAVESILAHRRRVYGRGERWEFLVKWVGLDTGQNEWLPFRDLVDEEEHVINAALLHYAQDKPDVRNLRPDWDWIPS